MARWSEEETEKLRDKYPSTKISELESEFNRGRYAIRKKANRLGLEKEEAHQAKKRIPDVETPDFEEESLNWFISGFVAGEGSFTKSNNKERPHPRFKFSIEMSEVDSEILKKIKKYFNDAGNYYEYERNKESWSDTANYQIDNIPELVKIVIPFFEKYSFKNTHKQKQFDGWKNELYEEYNINEEHLYKT